MTATDMPPRTTGLRPVLIALELQKLRFTDSKRRKHGPEDRGTGRVALLLPHFAAEEF